MKCNLIAAGILLCLPTLSVFAQSESKDQEVIANGQQFGAWNVTCEAVGVNQTACTLSQNLFRDTDQAFIARLLTFWDAQGENTYVAARVPVGAHLPSGFAIKAQSSDQVYELTWQTCTPNFCEAMAQIEPSEIKQLSSEGGVIFGSYRPSIQMEPVAFSFAMSGADDGLEALKPNR